MSTFRPSDAKREEFRKYLERAGVMSALTKVLVVLYEEPEKPNDPIEYIRKQLGCNEAESNELEAAREEIAKLKKDLEEAMLENAELKARGDWKSDPPVGTDVTAEGDAPVEPAGSEAVSAPPPASAPVPAEGPAAAAN